MEISSNGAVTGMPRALLRLEGLALFALAGLVYAHFWNSWWLFVVLFLTPDLSMLGYLKNARFGAVTYNAIHTLTAPALLSLAGMLAGSDMLMALAVIWVAHIGFDRVLGYGLKYGTGFGDTHFGRLGRSEAASTPKKRLPFCKA